MQTEELKQGRPGNKANIVDKIHIDQQSDKCMDTTNKLIVLYARVHERIIETNKHTTYQSTYYLPISRFIRYSHLAIVILTFIFIYGNKQHCDGEFTH